MSKTTKLALDIVALMYGQCEANPEDVRAVQQLIEMELDNLQAERVTDDGSTNRLVIKDLQNRAAASLFENKGAVEMTKGEFTIAWTEQLIVGHVTNKGAVFTFMGVPVARKQLNG